MLVCGLICVCNTQINGCYLWTVSHVRTGTCRLAITLLICWVSASLKVSFTGVYLSRTIRLSIDSVQLPDSQWSDILAGCSTHKKKTTHDSSIRTFLSFLTHSHGLSTDIKRKTLSEHVEWSALRKYHIIFAERHKSFHHSRMTFPIQYQKPCQFSWSVSQYIFSFLRWILQRYGIHIARETRPLEPAASGQWKNVCFGSDPNCAAASAQNIKLVSCMRHYTLSTNISCEHSFWNWPTIFDGKIHYTNTGNTPHKHFCNTPFKLDSINVREAVSNFDHILYAAAIHIPNVLDML